MCVCVRYIRTYVSVCATSVRMCVCVCATSVRMCVCATPVRMCVLHDHGVHAYVLYVPVCTQSGLLERPMTADAASTEMV